MRKKKLISPNLTADQKQLYEKLARANMQRAYFAALGLLGSHDEAAEASQQAFIRAYRHFDKFDRAQKFFTWYYKILRNLCLNMIRDRKNRKELPINDEILSGSTDDAELKLENKELRDITQKVLFELDEEDREIIVLREFEGYSYKDTADILGVPQGTVMSRLYYARKRFYNKIKGYLNE